LVTYVDLNVRRPEHVAVSDVRKKLFAVCMDFQATSYFLLDRYSAGGGCIYASGSSLHMNNVTVSECHSASYGGGMALVDTTGAMRGSRVMANSASTSGGGIYMASNSVFELRDCTLTANTITAASSSSKGGAFYVTGSSTTIDIFSSDIFANSASNGPGKRFKE
jgi:predicted outer membrane repeat protein